MAIYKNHPFDETRPLRITFTGQPAAIDTGGPKGEFFDQVFVKACKCGQWLWVLPTV